MRKIVTILIVLAILAGGAYAVYLWREGQRISSLDDLQTETASLGELTATIGATGEVRAVQTANLYWKTSGTVGEVFVFPNDEVESGDVLATLKQTSLPQSVILAEAELVDAQKSLDELYTNAQNAKIDAMQAIVEYAQDVKDAQFQLDNYTPPSDQVNLDTMEALDLMQERLDAAREAFEPYKYFSSGNETRQELLDALNEAQSNYNSAVRRLEYEYELEVAMANLRQAREDYAKWENGPDPGDVAAAEARIAAAEATLSQAWIEAPFDGIITIVNPQPGDQVSPNTGNLETEAFRLDDLSTLLVGLTVSEVDINQVAIGQPVVITFDAVLGEEYHGVVVDVDQVGTVLQGVVDFIVTVELTDADENVKPGMTAAVNIVVNQLEDVLLVPNRAVRINDGKRVVYILGEGGPTPVEIELGASSDIMSQVVGGDLQVGDLIVLNPPTEFSSNGPPPFVRGR